MSSSLASFSFQNSARHTHLCAAGATCLIRGLCLRRTIPAGKSTKTPGAWPNSLIKAFAHLGEECSNGSAELSKEEGGSGSQGAQRLCTSFHSICAPVMDTCRLRPDGPKVVDGRAEKFDGICGICKVTCHADAWKCAAGSSSCSALLWWVGRSASTFG